MTHAFDANLMMLTSGTVTASKSVGPVTIYGTPIHGIAVRANVPSASGADDTVLVKVYASTDGSNYSVISQQRAAVKPYGGGKDIIVPFHAPHGQKTYVKAELVVTATTPATGFGSVDVGIVPITAEFDRTTNWS